jgi:hypothetical protein
VLENIYRHEGSLGHEVVFVFDVEFADPAAYVRDGYAFIDGDVKVDARWRKAGAFLDGSERLFPAGLSLCLAEPGS